MFGFIRKAAKTAIGAARSVAGNSLVRKGALIAAPLPVIATQFSAKHPKKAALIVATAGAAGPAVSAAVAARGGGDTMLPAMAAAQRVVDAAKGGNAHQRASARRALKRTKLRAKKGDTQAATALELARVAAQADSFARTGRIRIRRWYLYRNGRVTSA